MCERHQISPLEEKTSGVFHSAEVIHKYLYLTEPPTGISPSRPRNSPLKKWFSGQFWVPLALPVPSSRACFNTGKASATFFQQAGKWAGHFRGRNTPPDWRPVLEYPRTGVQVPTDHALSRTASQKQGPP